MNKRTRSLLLPAALFACCLSSGAHAADVRPVSIDPAAVPFGRSAEIDVTLSDSRDAGVTLIPSEPYQRRHWPLVHGGFDIAAGRDRFIVAGGRSGLLAVNRPESPAGTGMVTLLAGFDSRMLRVYGDDAYVIDARHELHVIDIAADQPRIQGSYQLPGPATDFVVSGGRAHLLLEESRLVVLDVQQPADIRETGRYPLKQTAHRILVDRDLVYVAVTDGLLILDRRDSHGIIQKGRYVLNARATVLAGHGDHVYLGSDRGLTVIDVSAPETPRWIASHHRLGSITDIVIDGEDMLVRNRAGTLTLMDIAIPAMPTMTAGYPSPEPVRTMLLQDRLAIVTTARGIAAIDFSPVPPAVSNELLDIGEGVNYGGQRRAFVDDELVYVADWFSGIHIYDISDRQRPRLLSSLPTPGSPKGIVVKHGIAYVADDDHGLQVIDVRDPRRPRHVANLPVNGLVYTPKIAGDRLYLASHRGGFQIVDISVPTRPQLLSETDTPGKAWSVDVQDEVVFIADDDNGLLIYDASRPEHPVRIGAFNPGGHLEEILVRGRYAYAAFFDDGVYVLDVSRPGQPQPLAHITTPGNARGLDLVGNTLLVADWLAGVHLVDITDPARAHIVGSYDTDGAAWGVRAAGADIACVLDWWGGFITLDISNPARPALAARYNGRGQVRRLAAASGYLFAVRDQGLQIFDINNPLNPTWITGIDFDTAATQLGLSGDTAYVALENGEVVVIDTSNPFAARSVGQFKHRGGIKKMALVGPVLYILDHQSRLTLFDITRRDRPRVLARLPGKIDDFVSIGPHLTVTGARNDILRYDVSSPARPRLLHQAILADEPGRIAAADDFLAVHIPGAGFAVFALTGTGLEKVGFHNFTGDVNDIAVAGGLLLASTGKHGLITVDLSQPDRPTRQSAYTLLNRVGEFMLHRGVVYFTGGEAIVALQLMPEIPAARDDAGRYRLTLPGDLPLGSYDLLITGGDGLVGRERDAVRVTMPGFSKPAFTMEDLEKALQQRGTGAR